MRLPNADRAIIPAEKLRDYLLNPEHKENRGKFRVFAAIGFTQANWEELAVALRAQHLVRDDGFPGRETKGGQTYIIIAPLQGPSGSANIRSIWQIEFGSEVPRLLSAYPP